MLLDREKPALVSPTAQKACTPRRRASRAGTRCVSMLNSVQLEKKRANDREAQKATRRRTKAHIEGLEAQIAELVANQEWAQNVLWLNKELELQNAELRSQLHSVEVLFWVGNGSEMPGRNFVHDGAGLGGGQDNSAYNSASQCYAQPLSADDPPPRIPPLGSPLTTPGLPQTSYLPHGSLYTDWTETLCSHNPVPSVSSFPLSSDTVDTNTYWHKESTSQRYRPNDIERAAIPNIYIGKPLSLQVLEFPWNQVPHTANRQYL